MKQILSNFSKKLTIANKNFNIAFFLLMFMVAGIKATNAQTISPTNGGMPGNDVVPPGWLKLYGTPDISIQCCYAGIPGYTWIGTVSLPPTAHTTWVSGYYNEIAGTTITGLTIGNHYTFYFNAAELRSWGGGYTDANYDGQLALKNTTTNAVLATYNFTGGSSNAWNSWTYSFTATDTILPISFSYVNGVDNDNFWNVSFSSNAVSLICNSGTTAPALSSTTKTNVCPATTVSLNTISASNLPPGTTRTWHTGTPATSANKLTNSAASNVSTSGIYYAAFYDATNTCYSGPGGNGSATTAVTVTINSCSTPLSVGTPAVITGNNGTTVTGNPPTGVTGGTAPYVYSDGTSDPLCVTPTLPTLALPSGHITGLNSSTGAHNINTVGLAPGTYEYCIKVCDSALPTPSCVISKHTITVTAAPCNAGSVAPTVN